jgi:hypothetical protein
MNINYGTSFLNYNPATPPPPASVFYMKFDNKTGSAVTVDSLNNLFSGYTGDPILITA